MLADRVISRVCRELAKDRPGEPGFLEPETFAGLLRQIGLLAPDGGFYEDRDGKLEQVADYLGQVRVALRRISRRRTVSILDCGCGSGYLTLLLACLLEADGRPYRITGVDISGPVIAKNRRVAAKLGLEAVDFQEASILDYRPSYPVDIVMGLHVCDQATDQTIAAGIRLAARYILSVSCCQHTSRRQLRGHGLGAVTRHPVYKERLVDMLGDALRALKLESLGYKVDLFEFTSATHTPKNVMLRAEWLNLSRPAAQQEYADISRQWGIEPALARYLGEHEAESSRPR